MGFREQAIEQAAEEKFLKEQILALEPYVRAHADRAKPLLLGNVSIQGKKQRPMVNTYNNADGYVK